MVHRFDGLSTLPSGERGRAILLSLLLVCGAFASTAAGAAVVASDGIAVPGSVGSSAAPVAECMTIRAPGHYELVENVTATEGPCLHVRASNVVLDGNGHTVRRADGDGGESPDVGLLAFHGAADGRTRAGDELTNVTVRNLRVAGWDRGVQLGGTLADGPRAILGNVTATGNDDGVVAYGADRSSLLGVRAADNEGDGVVLWETARATGHAVTAVDNGDSGLVLADSVRDATFTATTASRNDERGVVFGTSVGRNEFVDARVVDNGGPGIYFGDSFDNEVRDSRVASNGGPGVVADPGGGERVVETTVDGNPVAYRQRTTAPSGGVDADHVVLADGGTTVSFGPSVTGLSELDAAPTTPAETEVVGPVSNVTFGPHEDRGGAVFSVPYDESAVCTDEVVALWLFDGSEWKRLPSTIDEDGDVVTATAPRTGVVVPLAQPRTPDRLVGDESPFVVNSTGNGAEFAYGFLVNGSVEKAYASGVSADSEEHVETRDDGLVVALGSTGDNVGDAFTVTGEVVAFDAFPRDADVHLELDGREVTDDLLGERSDGKSAATPIDG